MIEISINKRQDNFVRLTSKGHANYAEHGSDIVCAGVSTLVINTINSLEKFTNCKCVIDSDEDKGYIDCIINKPCEESNLLMKSLVLGLEGIRDSYSRKYLEIHIKEV